VIIVDQHPTSVAGQYISHISHQLQRAYTDVELIYTAAGYVIEEVCDILQLHRPIRRELHFPARGTMPVTRARPASVASQYIVRQCGPVPCHEGM